MTTDATEAGDPRAVVGARVTIYGIACEVIEVDGERLYLKSERHEGWASVSNLDPHTTVPLDAFVRETPRWDDCLESHRFKAVLPTGFVTFHPTREAARAAILGAIGVSDGKGVGE